MYQYVCEKERFKIGGVKELNKGDVLSKSLVNDLTRRRVKTGKGEVITKLRFFTLNGFFKKVQINE